jgi:hypothetical protein
MTISIVFVVWPPPCTRGNKACSGLTRSLIVKTAGSGLGEGILEAYLHVEKTHGAIHGVTQPGAWPLRGHPCEELQQGLGESEELLDTSVKILTSSNVSLHLYSPLPFALNLHIKHHRM